MPFPIALALLAMTLGVGLCAGYLIGHTAAFEAINRRYPARRPRPVFDDDHADIERAVGVAR